MLGQDQHRTDLRQPSFSASPAQLGVWVGLAALSMLFGSSLVAYFITRHQSPNWHVPGAPGLPAGLLLSTLLIFATSVALHAALRAIRKNRFSATTRALYLTGLFALAFLVGQWLNWRQMWKGYAGAPSLYAFTFYMLTILHAVHVVGGFIPLGLVVSRASRREYSSSRWEGMRLCSQYWDFLCVVWLVILVALYVFD